MSTQHTPPKKAAGTERTTDSVSNRTNKRIRPEDSPPKDKLDLLREEIREMFADHNDNITRLISEVSDIKKEVIKVQESNRELERTIEYISNNYKNIKNQLDKSTAAMSQTQSELQVVSEQVVSLKLEINNYQQRERLSNLEIVGLPQLKNEDLAGVVIKIAEHAGVALTRDDLEHASRVQPRVPVPGRVRAVVVKLRSRVNKDAIISGLRKTRGVSTHDIGLPGNITRFFVNEHLTVQNKMLFNDVKAAAKTKLYKFVWIKNCQIYVRKDDVSPAKLIRDPNDIKKIS